MMCAPYYSAIDYATWRDTMGNVNFGPYKDERGLQRCVKCGKRAKKLVGPCEFGTKHVGTHAINIRRFQDGKFDEIHPSVLRTLREHEVNIKELD